MRRTKTAAWRPREKEKRMKKMFAVGATAALMLAATSPAFAAEFGDVTITETSGDDVEFNAVAQNISGGFGDVTQNQSGLGDQTATDDSNAVAQVAQEQDFTFVQFNSALNDF